MCTETVYGPAGAGRTSFRVFPEWIVNALVASGFPSDEPRRRATVTLTWPGTSGPRQAARERTTATCPRFAPAKLVNEESELIQPSAAMPELELAIRGGGLTA